MSRALPNNLSFGFNSLRFEEHFDEAWQKPSEDIARGTIASEVATRFCQDSQNAFEDQVVKPKTQVNRIEMLRDRAHMFATVRQFFATRGVLEVDVPQLSLKAPVDTHIDLIETKVMGKTGYLASSPEYGMKRLLAEGIGDIYQMSHVFRDGECGLRHNPEFTMIEWYRLGFSLEELMEETLDLLRLFFSCPATEYLSYAEALSTYAVSDDPDYALAFEVEPQLGQGKITLLYDFPPEKAALSQIVTKNGQKVAQRFEVFFQGFELANGYLELTDPIEQELRLHTANRERKALGKPTYPIDTDFLEALKQGLPPMCGVAVGFDRLLMLRHNAAELATVLPFAWDKAE